ncbi:MBL fold metallo-hydrolase [Thalassospira indica]|uniref:MBL fold metallo-hydrolase n=1 Tax=Thalassospira indica TaxID=1891279 RepID=A0ABM6Y4E5_9PROT|nr:MBL fold metallo-hydrolase [Thalassospira indica]AXO16386.1 MBL fold metallo-hydrolase [Thalassospira indica]OAZ13669.1 metal-dependent hydrolase [Thalassospira profundimaris]
MKTSGKWGGFAAGLITAALAIGASAQAQTVKVTPLGAVDGEFCPLDRAMIFEDPDGTRILYDTGRTVAGPDDARLGEIDAVLLSHMHGDHLGDRHIEAVNATECGKPSFPVDVRSVSNTVQIAHAKDALIVTGSEMPGILGRKLESIGGDPDKSVLVRFGASRMVGGVSITTVPAVHSNGVSGDFLGGPLGEMLKSSGVTAYAGPPTGYVLTFSNGLSVYLSGDTGITAEQDAVVRGHYGAKLVVMNIGDTYTTGPTEAAYVINDLIMPASVIPSHANEWATDGGNVRSGTRTEAFINAVSVPTHVPLSGRTMEFDSAGICSAGC